jgi:hypothetical protein
MPDRRTKITFGELRDMGVRGVLVYCADYRCSHSIAISRGQASRAGASNGVIASRTFSRFRNCCVGHGNVADRVDHGDLVDVYEPHCRSIQVLN